jgi:hypothetical protein
MDSQALAMDYDGSRVSHGWARSFTVDVYVNVNCAKNSAVIQEMHHDRFVR